MKVASGAATNVGRSMRRLVLAGIIVCLVLVGGFGASASIIEIAGAVLSLATIVVETDLKKVQHQTGGVVKELLVKPGDKVKAGDVVIRLDGTQTRANLAVVTKMLDELVGRRARLEAERDGPAMIEFPHDLIERMTQGGEVHRILAGEGRLFEARKVALAGQKAQLRERIAQHRQEIEGREAQLHSKSRQITAVDHELKGIEKLYKVKLVTLPRLTTLQREAAGLQAEHHEILAMIAQVKGKIAETELQIIQLDQDRQRDVLEELREVEGKIGELDARKIAAEDELRRLDICSPQDGLVHQLVVHTVGGVISPGETLMLIVPSADALTVDAKVAPQDIDQVKVRQKAVVRLSAFNQQTTPELDGTVTQISPGTTEDPRTGLSYYTVRIQLLASELERLHGLQLVHGMPAEVHIQTGARTILSLLVKPLLEQIAQAFRGE